MGKSKYFSDLSFAWYEYELQWEQFTKANPDYPILNLYYEDLKQVSFLYKMESNAAKDLFILKSIG